MVKNRQGKPRNLLFIYMNSFYEYCYKCIIEPCKPILYLHGCRYRIIERSKMTRRLGNWADLIITVGGDGTFLRASHYVRDTSLMLGVNPAPWKKEGFYTRATDKDFGPKLKRVLEGKFKSITLTRLVASINGKPVSDLALNEVYVGASDAYTMSRYEIKVGTKKEKQMSSGVIVSTASGSHAWYKSAGGKELPLGSERFTYIIREPYQRSILPAFKLLKGTMAKGSISLRCDQTKAVVVIDSLSKEHPIHFGDKVSIKKSSKKIKLVTF